MKNIGVAKACNLVNYISNWDQSTFQKKIQIIFQDASIPNSNFIAHLQDPIAVSKRFLWADRKAIFDTTTSHLRKLQHTRKNKNRHVSIVKWDSHALTPIEPRQLNQQKICIPGIATKECSLVWQIIYRAPTSNAKRWPRLPAIDTTRKHCKRCALNCVETTEHVFQECWKAQKVWDCVNHILPITSSDPKQTCNLSISQALLDGKLIAPLPYPLGGGLHSNSR